MKRVPGILPKSPVGLGELVPMWLCTKPQGGCYVGCAALYLSMLRAFVVVAVVCQGVADSDSNDV